jgi:hypothetical protein
MEPLIDDKLAAKMLQKSVQSLRNDRCHGRGLPYVKLGNGKRGSVRYRVCDIAEYIEQHMIQPAE